jgi:hypothetical protein
MIKLFTKISLLLLLMGAVACTSSPKNQETVAEETEEDEVETVEAKLKRPSPPHSVSATVGETLVTLDYSSPSTKGRAVWGSLVPYNEIWRTGANEANVFTTESDILINDQLLPAGKYALFTIPGENKWSVIFNTKYDQWGAYDYDAGNDKLVIEVTPSKIDDKIEQLSFVMDGDGNVTFFWEYLTWNFKVKQVPLPPAS